MIADLFGVAAALLLAGFLFGLGHELGSSIGTALSQRWCPDQYEDNKE